MGRSQASRGCLRAGRGRKRWAGRGSGSCARRRAPREQEPFLVKSPWQVPWLRRSQRRKASAKAPRHPVATDGTANLARQRRMLQRSGLLFLKCVAICGCGDRVLKQTRASSGAETLPRQEAIAHASSERRGEARTELLRRHGRRGTTASGEASFCQSRGSEGASEQEGRSRPTRAIPLTRSFVHSRLLRADAHSHAATCSSQQGQEHPQLGGLIVLSVVRHGGVWRECSPSRAALLAEHDVPELACPCGRIAGQGGRPCALGSPSPATRWFCLASLAVIVVEARLWAAVRFGAGAGNSRWPWQEHTSVWT